MTTGERMKARRKEISVPVEEIAKALNVSVATVYRYENGEIEKVPRAVLEPLAKVLRTTPAFLMGWETSTAQDSNFSAYDNIMPMPEMRKVPLIGTIACGEPILAAENIEDEVDIPEHITADFALRCKGDSMINARIFDGDIVYIKQQPMVDDGEIAAVLIEDEATLKRVRIYPDHIVLEPENPNYRPYSYWEDEMNNVRIIGKAVAFTSKIG